MKRYDVYYGDIEESEDGDFLKVSEVYEWLKQYPEPHSDFCEFYDPRFKLPGGTILEKEEVEGIIYVFESPTVKTLFLESGVEVTKTEIKIGDRTWILHSELIDAMEEYLHDA